VRAGSLQRALRDQSAELGNIHVLEDAARLALSESSAKLALDHARAQKRLLELGDAQRWHETRRVLREEARDAERMLADVRGQLSLWETRRSDITRARELRELRPLRRQAEVFTRESATQKREAERQQQAFRSAREALKEAEQALKTAREAQMSSEEARLAEDEAIRAHEAALQTLTTREERVGEARRSFMGLQAAEREATAREREAEKSDAVFARERKLIEGRLAAHPEPEVDALAALLRRALHEGEGCPVCGSVEHPHARLDKPHVHGDAVGLAKALDERRTLEAKQQSLALDHERTKATLAARREERLRRTEERVRVEGVLTNASDALSVERESVSRVHGKEAPAQRRERLVVKERSLRQAVDLASRNLHGCEARLAREEGLAAALTATLVQLERDGASARAEWLKALEARALSEAEVRRLDAVTDMEIDSWSLELGRLDRMLLERSAVVDERRRRLDAHELQADASGDAGGDATAKKEAIDAAIRSLLPEVEALAQARAETQARLAEDDARRALYAERHAQLSLLREEAQTWDALTRAMGSADGKKLRVLVQSIALDVLVLHANKHLDALAPRYQLVRRTEGTLGLDVIDGELDPTPRSTSSLSGGERFQVSLALALGLGSMTAEREEVGTLFLDEGFGALDEKSLEQALEVLDALHQAGRQIGIVSHVARIAERFDVRVDVSPSASGSSTVTLRAG
jgi:exonuclease SbcC